VGNRCGEHDVSHALAAHGGTGHFDTTLIANNAFITGVLIFTAVTLPVTLRTKNGFTEETIFFRAQTAVVNGFGFQHLTIRP
jgi:hypothetical protein